MYTVPDALKTNNTNPHPQGARRVPISSLYDELKCVTFLSGVLFLNKSGFAVITTPVWNGISHY